MIWSVLMHAFMGYFGTTLFTISPQGILFAVGIALLTQGVNLFQIKRDLYKKAEEELFEKEKREAKQRIKKKVKKKKKDYESKADTENPATLKARVVVENLNQILIRAFVKNSAICSAVTLLVAEIARSKHIGL